MATSSSTLNSTSVASCGQTFKPSGVNIDITWQYNYWKDINNKKKVTCDFCNMTSSGGISRAKKHQLGIKGDVVACLKISAEVKAILHADMVEK
ncbi:unnamed protein product [Lathyrus oleraceus]